MALDGQKVDLLVYAGPGNLERPDNAALLSAASIVFFEPDPERRRALVSRFKGQGHIQVRDEALSGSGGYARLGQYNDANINSLRAPTDLLRFIPGLRHVGYQDVKRVDAAEYVSGSVDKGSTIRLVLDVNGEEVAILKRLAEASLLGLFAEIHVYTGVAPLFDGAGGRSDVMEMFRSHGLIVKAEVGPGGFLACVRARRNELLQTRKAEAPHADAAAPEAPNPGAASAGPGAPETQPVASAPAERQNAEAAELRSQLEAAQKKIDALTEDNKAKDAELQAQNRRASTAKTMITKLRKRVETARDIAIERDELRVELADARAEAAAAEEARTEASAQLESVRAELANARKQIEEGEALRQALANDLAQAQSNSQAARSDAEAKTREMSEHAKALEALKAELEESTRLAKELEARNSRFDGEFVRAEAQLDLIKELLFHDQPE